MVGVRSRFISRVRFFSTTSGNMSAENWGRGGQFRGFSGIQGALVFYCLLLFIRSSRFFRSSRLAEGEAERVCVGEGAWAVCSCW